MTPGRTNAYRRGLLGTPNAPKPPAQEEEIEEITVQMSDPAPFPFLLVSGMLFVVFLLLSIIVGYFSDTFSQFLWLSYILLFFAVLCLVHAVIGAIRYHMDNRTEHPQMTRLVTYAVVGLIVAGPVVGAVTFVLTEPYNDWSYSVELRCTYDCVADLPVPVLDLDHNKTFFTESELKTVGQGYVEIVRQDHNGTRGLALRVHWSGNFTIKVSKAKDYRHLPVNRSGLFDKNEGKFVVIGKAIPNDGNITFSLDLDHKLHSQVPRQAHWLVQGQIKEGVNLFSQARS